ncbi:MAG: DUF2599 domain-containing protein [Actinomycetia bacterium]|nr:DUF2599 domain-containing protein [Actinomycetes bacterium]
MARNRVQVFFVVLVLVITATIPIQAFAEPAIDVQNIEANSSSTDYCIPDDKLEIFDSDLISEISGVDIDAIEIEEGTNAYIVDDSNMYVEIPKDISYNGMYQQYQCHAYTSWINGEWNLEPARPAVGLARPLNTFCNP